MFVFSLFADMLSAPMNANSAVAYDHCCVNMAHLEPDDLNFKLQRPKNLCNIKNEHTPAAVQ
jgi:hypothetical protein